jgi:hypothetical protein
MKVYLNDEKTHVDPWFHNNILLVLKALCDKIGFQNGPSFRYGNFFKLAHGKTSSLFCTENRNQEK